MHLIAKKVSKLFLEKLRNLPYQEQFNYETKNIAQFAFTNGAIFYYNAGILLSVYTGYLLSFLIHSISVYVYGGGWGANLVVFLTITLVLQKVEVHIHEVEYEHILTRNSLNRRKNYYRNNIFLNKQSNLMLKIYDASQFFYNKYDETIDNITQDEVHMNKKVFGQKLLLVKGLVLFSF